MLCLILIVGARCGRASTRLRIFILAVCIHPPRLVGITREGETPSTRDTAFLYITGLSSKPRLAADVDPQASLEVGSIAPRLTL